MMLSLSKRMWRWVNSHPNDPPSLRVVLVAAVATGIFQIDRILKAIRE